MSDQIARREALPGVVVVRTGSVVSASRPDPNPDPEARAAAMRTHSFDPELGRCVLCDCRPWGTWAEWPCTGP